MKYVNDFASGLFNGLKSSFSRHASPRGVGLMSDLLIVSEVGGCDSLVSELMHIRLHRGSKYILLM